MAEIESYETEFGVGRLFPIARIIHRQIEIAGVADFAECFEVNPPWADYVIAVPDGTYLRFLTNVDVDDGPNAVTFTVYVGGPGISTTAVSWAGVGTSITHVWAGDEEEEYLCDFVYIPPGGFIIVDVTDVVGASELVGCFEGFAEPE